jgi:lauroyl/myristoyl acyltransferase
VRPRAAIHDGLLYWSWRIAATLVQRLPKRLVYSGAVLGGELGYLLWRRRREITKGNFAVVLGKSAAHPEVAGGGRRAGRK